MAYNDSDRILALAGVCQAAQLTAEIARLGKLNSAAMEASIHSLYQFDPDSVAAAVDDFLARVPDDLIEGRG